VVTEGSFFVKAERERLGLRPAASTANTNATSASSADGRGSEAAQTAKVVVSEQGYEPAKVTLRAIAFACGMNMLKGVIVVE